MTIWDQRTLEICREARKHTDEDYAAGRVVKRGDTVRILKPKRTTTLLHRILDVLYPNRRLR